MNSIISIFRNTFHISPLLRRTGIVLLLLCISGASIHAQTNLSREQIDSLLHPRVIADAERIVRFDSTSLHLPPLIETDTARHSLTFHFVNTGTKPLSVTRANATCGCTKVTYIPTGTILSGQRDSIVVQYTPKRDVGTIDEPIYVYVKDKTQPVAALHVLGYSSESSDAQWRHLPASMGALRIKRKEITFSNSDNVMRIMCANTSPAPLRLRAALIPPYATLHSEPSIIQPNQEADIVITIHRDKLPDVRPLRANIIIDGVPCDMASRTIKLTIQ